MEVDVFDIKGQTVSTIELPAHIFAAQINVDLMHQAYIRQIANARLGTHKTKTRSEVSGGGRKPWRQKGTGRARQGSIRSPQWVGGGGVHTPRPRDYSLSMPRKMRKAALRSALSVKAKNNDIMVLKDLSMEEPRTRLMAEIIKNLVGEGKVLVIIPNKIGDYDFVLRAINNLPNVKPLMANYLNVRDLLGYEKIIMPIAALDVIQSYL
ncbi:MAG: 50S ribosomal protein L4 [Anaerolineales bacterium]|nr:50S ribosomal protein L4 [Anaerolineales bacterium]